MCEAQMSWTKINLLNLDINDSCTEKHNIHKFVAHRATVYETSNWNPTNFLMHRQCWPCYLTYPSTHTVI